MGDNRNAVVTPVPTSGGLVSERFDDQLAAEWDEFVDDRSRNGTILHTRRFFAHNPGNAGEDASLLFRKRGRILGVFPAAVVERDAERVLHSHPRATYGGFVVGDEAGVTASMEMVDLVIDHAQALAVQRIVVRNPFRIFHHAPTDESDYAMWRRGFTVRARELEVAIPLQGIERDAVLGSLDAKTRNQVRKAWKSGVIVRETTDFDAFWRILEQNLETQHNTRPTHALADILRLRDLVGADRVRLFAGYLDDTMLAGAVLFVANSRAVHAQYLGSLREHAPLCPLNALVAELIAWASEQGYHYLNLGMSTEDEGRRINTGLFDFKEGFGGRGVLRETMELTLTAK